MNIFSRGMKVLHSGGPTTLMVSVKRYITSEIKLAYDSITLPFLVPSIIKNLKSKSENLTTPNELVDFAFNFKYMGFAIDPLQIKDEITDFLNILSKHKIENMLEIGTDRGGTLFLYTRLAAPNATIISLNLPFSKLNAWCMKYRNMIYSAFGSKTQKMHFISASSHEPVILENVKTILNGSMLDFLFIDGDHSYEGVKEDYRMYSSLVKKGGIIAFHDITKSPTEKQSPVNTFWNEVKRDHKGKSEEIHATPNSLGIGILYV